MKTRDFIVNFSFFPLKNGKVTLPTTAKSFLSKLGNITEKDFDFGQFLNVTGESHKHEYQSEISNSTFKLRRIQKPGYKASSFTGTIIYGKLIESKDQVILKYFATFNVFTTILFLIILMAGLYGVFVFLNSGLSDYTLLMMFLFCYLVFLVIFDSEISTDINFIESLIRSYDVKTKVDT